MEGDLRLDDLAAAKQEGVIVPFNSKDSRLVHRITAASPDDRMPAEGEPLSDAEIAIVRKWIDGGAAWPAGDLDSNRHWAYVKPERPAIPAVARAQWTQQPIDHFVLEQLERNGIAPSPLAPQERLIRRVTLDLTGLPPTLEEVDAFLSDDRPDAFDRLVDRLLASAAYGERWATPWLDAARYADSNGFQRDDRRSAWPYRDWVVRALNADMPFDQFTIEQLAGDLLPNPTVDQLAATGFHRASMTNLENGIDPAEQQVVAIFDRVNTTAAVWLGTTLQCAQCHDHKYDPFSLDDYYRLYAFFNSTETEIEPGQGGYDPKLIGPKIPLYSVLPKPEQTMALQLDTRIAKLQSQERELTDRLTAELAELDERPLRKPNQSLPRSVSQLLKIPKEKRSLVQAVQLQWAYQNSSVELQELKEQLRKTEEEFKELVPTTLVMRELAEPRITHVFRRGNFLDTGHEVQPATPAALPPMPADAKPNRLTLAKWLVDENNPLAARVVVNRHWNELFGRSLVATPDDFGTRGEPPTHPELLDWLSSELVSKRWSVKTLHRMIVTSATYRQSARMHASPAKLDPDNRLYARGPRKRLPAESIRDQALAIGGLLSQRMYGSPVFPYQPPGVWRQIDTASNVWTMSNGDDPYRRGLYVYRRRTSPYPSFVNFDAPSRELCAVQRSESITPLQALTLQNDRVFVEAAAGLARRLLTEMPEDSQRIAYGFRLVTCRHATRQEQQILADVFAKATRLYDSDRAAAEELCRRFSMPETVDPVVAAAWIHLARVLLNLDEAITSG